MVKWANLKTLLVGFIPTHLKLQSQIQPFNHQIPLSAYFPSFYLALSSPAASSSSSSFPTRCKFRHTMAHEDSMTSAVSEQQEKDPKNESNEQDPDAENSSSDESDSEYSSGEYTDYENEEDEILNYVRPGDALLESENTAEANIKLFTRILDSERLKRREEEEEMFVVDEEEQFNFPKDPENWREEDLRELWADAPLKMTKPGWDPVWADEDDWEVVKEEVEAGREPPIAPFYLPYRKPYPAIPTNHFDISSAKAVVHELDRIEEFLKWVSYIFADGSSYEGTVWDDLAHGKGVYVAEQDLVRYEGEWLQNNMEGHGVVEVDIPDIEPVPGSKLEEEMRAEGKIIERDYMTPEDRKWLEMDVEDAMQLTDGNYEIPFYENDVWLEYFGSKPEKGRYRYAGQWKHGRMHGCGVFELNERVLYGRFYFGEFLEEATDCDADVSALHKGIAEVAAAKARMFVNKPDGMVREDRGPYNDPQHPYFYEEEDVWMAPGFINQFYEVPEYWKTYVGEVDEEREMWLNSFYKAPLRLPMPAELEYLWSQDPTPEFILLNKEPEPDPKDPSKLIRTKDPIILHTPTGNLINFVEDEEYGIRLFWQPDLKVGEEVDPEKLEFLPLGFDEFYGLVGTEKKENIWMRLVSAVENALIPAFDKLEKWSEQKKREGELKIQLIEKERELREAQMRLEELMEEIEEDLKMKEKEDELKVKMGLQEEEKEEEEEDGTSLSNEDEKALVEEKKEREEEEEEEEEAEEEEDEEEDSPSSFGSVRKNQDSKKNDQEGNKPRNSPFSALSLSFASGSLFSVVPNKILQSLLPSRKVRTTITDAPSTFAVDRSSLNKSISFPRAVPSKASLKISPSQLQPRPWVPRVCHSSSLARTHKRRLKDRKTVSNYSAEENKFSILSLHTPIHSFKTLAD